MAELRMLIDATADDVWSVLADGWSYADWVVGTGAVHHVEDGWPAVGTSLVYHLGAGRFSFDDRTVSRVCEPGRRLELEAFAGRAGTARIGVRVEPWGEHALVFFDEHALRGPGARLHVAPLDVFIHLRNRRTVANLARLASARAGRERQTHSARPTP